MIPRTELYKPFPVQMESTGFADNMADITRRAQIVELMGDVVALRGIWSSGRDLRIKIHSFVQQNTRGMQPTATYSFKCASPHEAFYLAKELKALKYVKPQECRAIIMGMDLGLR